MPRDLSIMRTGRPARISSIAAAKPVGPAPTIRMEGSGIETDSAKIRKYRCSLSANSRITYRDAAFGDERRTERLPAGNCRFAHRRKVPAFSHGNPAAYNGPEIKSP